MSLSGEVTWMFDFVLRNTFYNTFDFYFFFITVEDDSIEK